MWGTTKPTFWAAASKLFGLRMQRSGRWRTGSEVPELWSGRISSFLLALSVVQISAIPSSAQIPLLSELAGDWQKAADVRSLPALNNCLGSAQAVRDVLAVGKLSFPPITMTGDTGSLLLDDKEPHLERTRWYPYQILRTGTCGTLGVETAVRLTYEKPAVLFRIIVTNNANHTQTCEVKINLTAATSRHSHWGWGVPRDKDAAGHFEGTVCDNAQTLMLRAPKEQLFNCFGFASAPEKLSTNQATWRVTLKPQAAITLNYVLAIGYTEQAVHALAREIAANFDTTFERVETDWQNRFNSMFQPGNSTFSGCLPTLVTSDSAMRRIYYMSVASLLSVCRTGFPVQPRVYVSNSPESNCTMMYFWDTREWATVFALLDPAMLKQCLRSWLALGITNGYAEEYLTGTLQGPWYSANDYSVFILLDDYVGVTGDRAFLSERIGGRTVLDHMVAIASHWQSLVRPGRTLADYGKPANLLECVPTYINEVPSFNSANIWMLRRTAEIEAAEGNTNRAEELRGMAAKLLPAVLALYEPREGVWDSLHRDGTRVQMRHVFDFTTIGLTIPQDLTQQMRNEMTSFVERELLTDHWMRAQSLSDPAAARSDRPDHGPMGAFCAWPAETIATFCEFGAFPRALDFLHRCAEVTREGPFSQSRELMGKSASAPVRIAERGAGGRPTQTYNASNGGSFAEAILRGFFGYRPELYGPSPTHDLRVHGFQGELLNVRLGDGYLNLTNTGFD